MTYITRLPTLSALALSTALCPAGAAWAQDSASASVAEDGQGLDEIVVVARQRTESLQDVPISATVFTGAALAERGIINVKDVVAVTPNVSMPDVTGATNNVDIVIRGISTNTRNAGFESGAGVYIDGVYAGRSNAISLGLVDVESLEVLRGPQGTNFGKNTTAGAINIRTRKPQRDLLEYGGSIEYARFNDISGDAHVNLPLGANAALRATVFARDSDGYVLNVADSEHYANHGFYAGRLQLGLWAGDRFDLTMSADYRRDDHYVNYPEVIRAGTGFGVAGLFTVPSDVAAVIPGPYTVDVDYAPTELATRWGLGATMNYDLGGGYTLTSITGYRFNETKNTADNDNGSDPTFVGTAHVIVYDKTKHFTQELRVASPSGEPFTFVAGAYFLDMKIDAYRSVTFPPPNTIQIFVNVHNRAKALFLDGQLEIADGLKLNAGVRYTNEVKRLNRFDQLSSGGGFTYLFGSFSAPRDRLESSQFTPRIGLSYELAPDINSYFTFSRGYKSGGWNPDYTSGVATSTPRFLDERVDNYEAGLKMLLLDRRLRFNLAAFNMDFSNQQVQQQIGVRFDITNAGQSRIRGVEADIAFRALDNLTLSGGFGYVDARYRDFPNCAGSVDCTGNRLINAPKWTLNAAADLTVPAGDWGEVKAHAEYSYRGDFYAAVYNDKLDAAIGTDALLVRPYHDVSASIGIGPEDGRWQAALFVNNLLNRVSEAGRMRDTLVSVNALAVNYYPPRVVGIRLSTKFSGGK